MLFLARSASALCLFLLCSLWSLQKMTSENMTSRVMRNVSMQQSSGNWIGMRTRKSNIYAQSRALCCLLRRYPLLTFRVTWIWMLWILMGQSIQVFCCKNPQMESMIQCDECRALRCKIWLHQIGFTGDFGNRFRCDFGIAAHRRRSRPSRPGR